MLEPVTKSHQHQPVCTSLPVLTIQPRRGELAGRRAAATPARRRTAPCPIFSPVRQVAVVIVVEGQGGQFTRERIGKSHVVPLT